MKKKNNIRFLIDEVGDYEEAILQELKAYNFSQLGEKEYQVYYAYALNQGQVVGALVLKYSWDWITIQAAYYDSISIFETLLDSIRSLHYPQAQGIRYVVSNHQKHVDALACKLQLMKVIPAHYYSVPIYYFNDVYLHASLNKANDVIITTTPHVEYHHYVAQKEMQEQKQDDLWKALGSLRIVALEQDRFVGGVSCEINPTSLFISKIALHPHYRRQGIGRKLMQQVEKEARKRGVCLLELGTSDFQALDFYQKLGYQMVYQQPNFPKGHQTYTLVKLLS